MSLLNVAGSVEYGVGLIPSTLLIQTSDTISTVMGTGYLNGSDETFGIIYANTLMALVTTSDLQTPVWLAVSISGSDVSLIAPSSLP